ncbi:MAG: regulatory iron-sulfur-containing complex subunit RicT, partial [Pseudomonadota bacterium]
GDCGKPVCCNTHLSAMPPVSMKMAKLQKATLDPTKISGRCGRLKCCLRYEYDTYVDIQRELPPIGSDVVTNNGRARVINQAILAEQLLVEMEDHRRVLISTSDVLTVLKKGSGRPAGGKGQGGRRNKKDSNKKDTKKDSS